MSDPEISPLQESESESSVPSIQVRNPKKKSVQKKIPLALETVLDRLDELTEKVTSHDTSINDLQRASSQSVKSTPPRRPSPEPLTPRYFEPAQTHLEHEDLLREPKTPRKVPAERNHQKCFPLHPKSNIDVLWLDPLVPWV